MSSTGLVGAVRAHRDVDGLVLTETEYQAGLAIEPHPHDEPMCCIVLAGAMTERWGRSKARCEAGALTYLPAQEPHGDGRLDLAACVGDSFRSATRPDARRAPGRIRARRR